MDSKYATLEHGPMVVMAQEDADRVMTTRRIINKKQRLAALESLENDIDSKVDIGGYPEAFEDSYEKLDRAYQVGKTQGQAEIIVFGVGFVLGVAAVSMVILNRKPIAAKAKALKARFTTKKENVA